MRISCQFRVGLFAPVGAVGARVSSAVYADSGRIQITVLKAGWFIGGSGGSGTLTFRGRRYPLSIGGLSGGLVFGASETHLVGRVSNIHSACTAKATTSGK
jgi:lipid-binding SYLF domain-containing protein